MINQHGISVAENNEGYRKITNTVEPNKNVFFKRDGRTEEGMDIWTDGWTDGRTDGWMDGRTDKAF